MNKLGKGKNMIYKHEKCRLSSKVAKILDENSSTGWKLSSVAMGDLATRYEMFFEKDENQVKKYSYKHEKCRSSSKVTKLLNAYAENGWKLVFHVIMGDLVTRHELFFEKEI